MSKLINPLISDVNPLPSTKTLTFSIGLPVWRSAILIVCDAIEDSAIKKMDTLIF